MAQPYKRQVKDKACVGMTEEIQRHPVHGLLGSVPGIDTIVGVIDDVG